MLLQAKSRKHPLLLLSGVGTNAIGYDLSPEVSSIVSPSFPIYYHILYILDFISVKGKKDEHR